MMRDIPRIRWFMQWLVAVTLLPWILAAEEIPDAARALADSELVEWKARVLQSPDFYRKTYGLDSIVVLAPEAVFCLPYVSYLLHKDVDIEWNQSGVVDPRGFATARYYVFPIAAAETLLGTLQFVLNERPEGGKFDERHGDYTTAGGTTPLDPRTRGVATLRERFPGYDVAHIHAEWSGQFYLLTDSTGALYRTSDPDDGLPLYKLRD